MNDTDYIIALMLALGEACRVAGVVNQRDDYKACTGRQTVVETH